MLQIDPWDKAAECERYLQSEVDSTRREIPPTSETSGLDWPMQEIF
jgi:hypothetical protein